MKTITNNRKSQKIVRARRPSHPGAVLRDILNDLEPRPTQQRIADLLGVSRQTVVQLLAEQRGISPEMAHRLARAFGMTAEMWMGLQADYDLWQVEHDAEKWPEIEKISRLQAA